MPDVGKCGREGSRIAGVTDVELLQQTLYGRVLQENQLRFPDHDRLMSIADVISVIGPFLRGLRANDVDGLNCFLDYNDRFFGIQDEAIAILQDSSGGKRNGEFNTRVRSSTAVPLPPVVPSERDGIALVSTVLGT